MGTKDKILRFVLEKKSIKTADVVRFAGISRQAAAKHLRELIASKRLLKEGSTRSARYIPFNAAKAASSRTQDTVLVCRLRGLEEDRVFDQLAHRMGLKRQLSPAAFRIVRYAFTEMLNNAIDHSHAVQVRIQARFEAGRFTFWILDRGIGAFESVRKKFKLKDAFEAAEHLLKGKQTTAPERHSGQGIFFTSRIADHFTLESAALKLDVNNTLQDVALLDIRAVRGTRVTFSLKQRSRKDLKKLFDSYTDSELVFDKTEVRVRLSRAAGDYVSRSEARRLLFGLEKFKRIVMDFSEARGVGQGFADEVFRVFTQKNPSIRIEPVHMSPSVAFIVNRARQESLRSQG
jgi:anti-sigma regulatory factor (Ser/Thr protein kinase)